MAKRLLKKVGGTGLSLPDELSTPCMSLSDYIILIYGREKIGKTALCARFPNALFLMFEPGGKSLKIYQKDVYTWVDFKGYIGLLKEDERVETIVIDTVDLCFKMCLEYVMKFKLAGDHPADVGYGKGWAPLNTEFPSVSSDLCKSNKGGIFRSHDAEKRLKLRTGGEYEVLAPTMQA